MSNNWQKLSDLEHFDRGVPSEVGLIFSWDLIHLSPCAADILLLCIIYTISCILGSFSLLFHCLKRWLSGWSPGDIVLDLSCLIMDNGSDAHEFLALLLTLGVPHQSESSAASAFSFGLPMIPLGYLMNCRAHALVAWTSISAFSPTL